ncbi:MAG: hypothetical protein NZ765_08040 [Anaerolineae bacterium]|nr:hypothetical protein [Anaerolineae bacterium]MDW8071027.1 hypothetical protein [Anaerolineae bacterium]
MWLPAEATEIAWQRHRALCPYSLRPAIRVDEGGSVSADGRSAACHQA